MKCWKSGNLVLKKVPYIYAILSQGTLLFYWWKLCLVILIFNLWEVFTEVNKEIYCFKLGFIGIMSRGSSQIRQSQIYIRKIKCIMTIFLLIIKFWILTFISEVIQDNFDKYIMYLSSCNFNNIQSKCCIHTYVFRNWLSVPRICHLTTIWLQI